MTERISDERLAEIQNDYMQQVSASLARDMEAEIATAVEAAMPGAALDEIKRRCRLTTLAGQPGEYFEIDGKPVLYFGPLQSAMDTQSDRYVMRVWRDFRKLP